MRFKGENSGANTPIGVIALMYDEHGKVIAKTIDNCQSDQDRLCVADRLDALAEEYRLEIKKE